MGTSSPPRLSLFVGPKYFGSQLSQGGDGWVLPNGSPLVKLFLHSFYTLQIPHCGVRGWRAARQTGTWPQIQVDFFKFDLNLMIGSIT